MKKCAPFLSELGRRNAQWEGYCVSRLSHHECRVARERTPFRRGVRNDYASSRVIEFVESVACD